MCKPNRGKRVQNPELLDELYNYCQQDVVAEREIAHRLRPLNPKERQVWELDQRINARGVNIDTNNVDNALAIYEAVQNAQLRRLQVITGLENPNSRDQFHRWLKAQGIDVPDVTKTTLTRVLAEIQ